MWPLRKKNLAKQIPQNKRKWELIEGKYKVEDAFSIGGKVYRMFSDPAATPTGRALAALTIYEEFNMRCTRDYLELHCKAVDSILSDPKKINISHLVVLHRNLKERLNMALFPEHVYKLASVIFFDESESPYNYDYQYNNKKIEEWKAAGGTLDFFLTTPLRELIPSLQLPEENVENYFRVAELVDGLHKEDLQEVLSSEG